MRTYKQQNWIDPDQLTEVTLHIRKDDGNIYAEPRIFQAKRMKNKPCSEQCDLFRGQKCNGYCYRWANFKEIVFVTAEPEGDYELIETPFAKSCREMMERLKAPLPTEQKKGE